MDTQAANRIWPPTQPRHYTTREKIPLSRQLLKMGTRWAETCWATYKEQLIRRNKYNTKWHLVGFLFHIVTVDWRCAGELDHSNVLHYAYSNWTFILDVSTRNLKEVTNASRHLSRNSRIWCIEIDRRVQTGSASVCCTFLANTRQHCRECACVK